MPALNRAHSANFDALLRAARCGDLALLDCADAHTGEPVPTIVAVGRDADGFTFTPLARLFEGDPFEQLRPPLPAGGYA